MPTKDYRFYQLVLICFCRDGLHVTSACRKAIEKPDAKCDKYTGQKSFLSSCWLIVQGHFLQAKFFMSLLS